MHLNPINGRINKSLTPLNQRNVTPQIYHNKFNNKDNLDTIGQSYGPNFKQFSESPITTEYQGKNRRKEGKQNQQLENKSIAQINLQLDNNFNEIIFCFNKRKQLINFKKRKIHDQIQQKFNKAKTAPDNQWTEYAHDPQFLKVASFGHNPTTSINILSKMVRSLPNYQNSKTEQDNKSDGFWAKNRKLENEIDTMLAKLRLVDKNLEKTNNQVIDICKNLDTIQDNLKNLIGLKASENLQKVQPLFLAKNRNYQGLNLKIKQRQQVKDNKIQYVKSIKEALNQLKGLRQDRIGELSELFGDQNFQQLEKVGSKDQQALTNSFEALLKIKEKDSYLQLQQKQSWNKIQTLSKDQDHFYAQMIRMQSQEAKQYQNYIKIMMQRIKYYTIMNIFGANEETWKSMSMDPKQLARKFKQYKASLKRFLDQDSLIKQGLIKTNQTMRTFLNILRATQNQKQRRQQLLRVLQKCIKRRSQYQQKKEELRKLQIQQTKNQQQKNQFQEELEVILSDGDIESYKKIGNAIGKCQNDRAKLLRVKNILERQLEQMDKEVVGMANHMQEQYEDILCEIIPSDYQYSLRNGQDVKKIRNYIRKMYKRLGIIKTQ